MRQCAGCDRGQSSHPIRLYCSERAGMASPIADGQPAALSAMMEMVWFACGAALLALCVWLYVVRSPAYTRRSTSSVLTPDTAIRSAPLLSETDIVFYNL